MTARAYEPDRRGRVPWRRLLSWQVLLAVWLPIAVVGVAHYATAVGHHWLHDVFRRLYYLPIVLAAFLAGLRGGLLAAAVASATYLPHAFFHFAHLDPASSIEKALEILLYHVVGGVAGHLADRERARLVELRRTLKERERLTEQLARAGRLSALGELVAGVAHEIKNPLHSLAGTAEIVGPLVPPDRPEHRMWELHVEEIGRLQRVAERFLSFARPTPLQLRSLDLGDVARRTVELVSSDARHKGVTVELDVPDEPVTIRGDADQLAQVGLNIIVNAFNALADRDGTVRVSVAQAAPDGRPMGTLRIENDGPPIPPEEREHLFDPFHAGDEQGTGLGLSISSRIVDQHGGYIEAANDGLGVSFTVFLPVPEGRTRGREGA